MSTPTTEKLSLALFHPGEDSDDGGPYDLEKGTAGGQPLLPNGHPASSTHATHSVGGGTSRYAREGNALGMTLLAPPYTPPTTPPKGERTRMNSLSGGRLIDWKAVLPIWTLSLAMGFVLVMSNKYILSALNFPYPIFLTTCHMGFAVIGTRIYKIVGPKVSKHMAVAETNISWHTYSTGIFPIGVLFSASLILSNSAVMMLSISLVQMLKAFVPAAILITSALFGIRKLTLMSTSVILIISFGCALAAYGEVRFSIPGFICQAGAVLSESLRMVLIQILLQGHNMDPLTSLYHYSPVCFILNLILIPLIEGPAPFVALFSPATMDSQISLAILFANAAVAFSLNILGLILIQKVGGLILSLAGIVKDIALIVGSAVFFGNEVRGLQVFGYGLSILGLYIYRYKAT